MIIKMTESNNEVLSTSEFTSWYDNADNYHAYPKVFEKIEDILGCESNPDGDVSVDYEKLSTDDKKRITNLIKSKSESKNDVNTQEGLFGRKKSNVNKKQVSATTIKPGMKIYDNPMNSKNRNTDDIYTVKDIDFDDSGKTVNITVKNDRTGKADHWSYPTKWGVYVSESVSSSVDEIVTIGLYGDEVDGYASVDQLAQAFEDRDIEVLEKSGDFDYGWDLEVRGNARDIYNLVNNKITGYNCSSTQEFIDRYRIDESKSIKESANPDNAELNMKIAKTLGTKLAKEPKYRADLEAAGFEVIDDGWSTYKNWAVKGPNGNSVVLSKDYGGKARIYNGANNLATKQSIDAFDFVNYLTGNFDSRKDYRAHRGIGKTNGTAIRYNRDGSAVDADFSPETKTQQYHGFKKKINDANWDLNYHSDSVDKIERQIAELKKDIKYHLDKKSGAQDRLDALFDGIDVLLKSAGVRTESTKVVKEEIFDDPTDIPPSILDDEFDDYLTGGGTYGNEFDTEAEADDCAEKCNDEGIYGVWAYTEKRGDKYVVLFDVDDDVLDESLVDKSKKVVKESDTIDSPEYRIERYEMDLPDLMNTIHDAYMFGKVNAHQYAEALKAAYDALDNVEISKD